MFNVQQCRVDLEQFARDKEQGDSVFADSSSDLSFTDDYSSSEDSEESDE